MTLLSSLTVFLLSALMVLAAKPKSSRLDGFVFSQEENRELSSYPKAMRHLTPDSFKQDVNKGFWLVFYGSPHSAPCHTFRPTWDQLAEEFVKKEFNEFFVGEVDCSAHEELCKQNHIDSYPKIVLYADGQEYAVYDGKYAVADLASFTYGHLEDYASQRLRKTVTSLPATDDDDDCSESEPEEASIISQVLSGPDDDAIVDVTPTVEDESECEEIWIGTPEFIIA